MGMPASAAQLFKALTQDDNTWLRQEAKELMSKFSLFAIILADPVKDPAFYNHIDANFPFFNRLTGENFLFFSIVRDAEHKKYNEKRKFRSFTDIQAYKQNDVAEKVTHSQLAIHAICTIMGVDYEETPCLIVSDNLQFGHFCKLNTTVSVLEKQLNELSRVADYLKRNPLTKSLTGLLKRFNETGQVFNDITELATDKNRMQIVAQILHIISRERDIRNITVDNLKYKIQQEILSGNEHLQQEIIDDTLSLLIPFIHIENRNSYERDRFESRDMTIEQPESIVLYHKLEYRPISISRLILNEWSNIQYSSKNYLLAASLILEQNHRLFNYTNDYSVYTFPLCKSFENEINLSVVQLMRKQLGVPMPLYFGKYFPNNDSISIKPSESLIQNPREIFLNKTSSGKWVPPGLGESRLAFCTLRLMRTAIINDWQPTDKLDFLDSNWHIIQKVRNLTTHSDPVPRSSKESLENSFSTLHSRGLLIALTTLKKNLRG